MALRVAHDKLRGILWHLAWFGCLVGLDLVCQQSFGSDYFHKTGFTGFAVALFLGMLPYRYAASRRERDRRAESHRAFMQRHRERMAGLS